MKFLKGRSKSYYNKFFASFIVVMVVPMLATVLIFAQAQSTVKEQILVASRNTLNQFFQRVDNVMANSWETCVSIASDQLCRQYVPAITAKSSRDAYLSYEIHNMLANYIGEKYYDIFVYYPSENHVISGMFGSGNLDYYYNQNYGTKGDMEEEFYRVVETDEGRPVLYSMNGKQEGSYLSVAMRQKSSKNEKNHYVVVVVFNPSYVEELMQGVEEDVQNGVSIIFNKGKETIRFTGDVGGDIQLTGYSQEKISYEENFGNQKYIVQFRESAVMGAYYAYAVPYKYFWSRLSRLYSICGVSLAVSIVLGVFVSKRQTVKNYMPFKEMVNNLQMKENILYDAKEYTELEFIEDILEKTAEEKLELSKNVRKGQNAKREKFIRSLLNGRVEVSEKGDNVFKENGIQLCSDDFCVTLFQVETITEISGELLAFVVCNVFQELCDREINGFVIPVSCDRFVILFNPDEKTRNNLYTILEEGKEFISQRFNTEITFGVSTVREGMHEIHMAYEEATLALKYSYLIGKGIIIDYVQIAGRGFKNIPSSNLKMHYKVLDYVAGKTHYESADLLTKEIMKDYGIDKNISLEEMECFKFEAISSFNRVMVQEGYSAEECKKKLLELLNKTTLEEFKVEFTDILAKMYLKKQEEGGGKKDICLKCREYIEKHFGDEQLSLVMLAEHVGVVPSYLSKLFKEKYRISVPDYIAQMRIKNAKIMLCETNLSVWEIGESTGFVNSNTFIRTFKQWEGITPGAYRSLTKDNK